MKRYWYESTDNTFLIAKVLFYDHLISLCDGAIEHPIASLLSMFEGERKWYVWFISK